MSKNEKSFNNFLKQQNKKLKHKMLITYGDIYIQQINKKIKQIDLIYKIAIAFSILVDVILSIFFIMQKAFIILAIFLIAEICVTVIYLKKIKQPKAKLIHEREHIQQVKDWNDKE